MKPLKVENQAYARKTRALLITKPQSCQNRKSRGLNLLTGSSKRTWLCTVGGEANTVFLPSSKSADVGAVTKCFKQKTAHLPPF